MSEHKVEVVKLGEIVKHPNAENLGITKVWDYTVITRLGQYNEGDLCAYIEPDYVVDTTRDEFSFLGDPKYGRIRAKKIRGIWSQGLLIPAPKGFSEGDCVMEHLGIVRFAPKVHGEDTSGIKDEHVPNSLRFICKYDLQNLKRYGRLFEKGESIHISKKIHGSNARYAFVDGVFYMGSRARWLQPDEPSWWKSAANNHPWIEEWCRSNPNMILYGEVYGNQELRYGLKDGEISFRAFDIMLPDRNFMVRRLRYRRA